VAPQFVEQFLALRHRQPDDIGVDAAAQEQGFLPVSGCIRTIGCRAPGTLLTSSTFSNPLCALPPLEWVAACIIVSPAIRFFVSSANVS
jgi:hypothetical protein